MPDPPIADFPYEFLELACRRCNRYGRYRMARLLRKIPAICPMPDAVKAIADCPRTFYLDPCQVEVVRERPRWWKPPTPPAIGRIRLRED